MVSRFRKLMVVVFFTLMLVSLNPVAPLVEAQSILEGPFVDKVTYRILEEEDARVQALINDEIDLISSPIDPAYLDTLVETENIDVSSLLDNGYGYISINCMKYPFNLTVFRRALAFALDKEAISDDVFEGLSQPQDSCVPYGNPFTIEGQMPYTYYEANVAFGNDLIDAAGFDIDPATGFRTTPHGATFDVLVECPQSSNSLIEISQKVIEALTAMDVNATFVSVEDTTYYDRIMNHGDYDIAVLTRSFDDFDVDWLGYEYWSSYKDEPYHNIPNFENASYDSWRDQLLLNNVYDEVLEAASEMQRIWVYECPEIICYQNISLIAHRNDRFDNLVSTAGSTQNTDYLTRWTNKLARTSSSADVYGGTLRRSLAHDPNSLNFMLERSKDMEAVFVDLYDSLIVRGPNGLDIPWLASSWIIETYHDNPSVVPNGHVRITFNLDSWAKWSDGIALTSEDIAFTLEYYMSSTTNPLGLNLEHLTRVETITTHQIFVEFNTSSYWNLHDICYLPIIPKHVFELLDPNEWDQWNPTPNNLVNSGPFNISGYIDGDSIELSFNTDGFHGDRIPPVILAIADFSIFEGTDGNQIVWNVTENIPFDYRVTRYGAPIESGSSSSSLVTVNLDGLETGTYSYALIVTDTAGNSASSVVVVTVLPNILLISLFLITIVGIVSLSVIGNKRYGWTIKRPSLDMRRDDGSQVIIASGHDLAGENMKLSIKIINHGELSITGVMVILDVSDGFQYTRDTSSVQEIGTIPGASSQSAIFWLKPLRCINEDYSGTVIYRDAKNQKITLDIPPKRIVNVCPMLTETERVDEVFAKLKTGSLTRNCSSFHFNGSPKIVFSLAESRLSGLRPVERTANTMEDETYLGYACYVGETKYADKRFASEIQVSGTPAGGVLTLSVYSDDESILAGFFVDMMHDVREHAVVIEEKSCPIATCSKCGGNLDLTKIDESRIYQCSYCGTMGKVAPWMVDET